MAQKSNQSKQIIFMKRVTFKTKIIFIKLSIETEKNILTYIVFFSLSKYLNEPHYETLIAIQIGIMEQTIAVIDKVGLKDSDRSASAHASGTVERTRTLRMSKTSRGGKAGSETYCLRGSKQVI